MSDHPDFKDIYPKSHYTMMGHSAEPEPEPPEKVDLDQVVYDDLIFQGRTPEYAKEQAEHAAFTKGVYYKSQAGPAPPLPYEEPEEEPEPPEEPGPGPDFSKIYPKSQ